MSALLCESFVQRPGEAVAPVNEEARAQVWSLLSGMYPAGTVLERRREQRYPYPRLFVLTPVEADGVTPAGPKLTAAGKHLSESGLSFYHPDPLPYRWVIVSLPRTDNSSIGFLVDLDWCRFTRQGWYESGGRFLKLVSNAHRVERAAS
jgi:hypothetical protein